MGENFVNQLRIWITLQ